MSGDRSDPARDFVKLVEDVQAYLALESASGRTAVELDPARLESLAHFTPADPPVLREPEIEFRAEAVDAAGTMAEIAARIAECTRCPLCESRTKTVPGQGALRPEIMFIGEGPGADEDRQGLAFVGRAGQLLSKIIGAMEMTRDEVWIGNIVKCRPPGNRVPYPDEMEACMPYLREQLAVLRPRVIVCLGATAVKGLLQVGTGITKLRGNWMHFEGYDVMPTFHPAYLLRKPAGKKDVWEDMKEVLKHLGRPVPAKKKR